MALFTTTTRQANARALGLCAALSQEVGLAPMIEPEILMNGIHPPERCHQTGMAALLI